MSGLEIGRAIGIAITLAAKAGDINAVSLEYANAGSEITPLKRLAEADAETGRAE